MTPRAARGFRVRTRLVAVRLAGVLAVAALAALALHLSALADGAAAGWRPLLLAPALAAGLSALLTAPPTARPSAEVRPDSDPDGAVRALLDLPPDSPWAALLATRVGTLRPHFRPVGEWAPALVLLACAGVGALAVASVPEGRPGPPPTASSGAADRPRPDAGTERPPAVPPRPEPRVEEDGAAAGAGREWPDARGALAPGAPADEVAAVERYLRLRAASPEAEANPQ